MATNMKDTHVSFLQYIKKNNKQTARDVDFFFFNQHKNSQLSGYQHKSVCLLGLTQLVACSQTPQPATRARFSTEHTATYIGILSSERLHFFHPPPGEHVFSGWGAFLRSRSHHCRLKPTPQFRRRRRNKNSPTHHRTFSRNMIDTIITNRIP